MAPLSKDREEKDGGVTNIDWDSIVSVSASERNPKEFSIFILPYGKIKGQKQGGNQQQEVYFCKERNRLITEIMYKLNMNNDEGKGIITEKSYHQVDMYNEKSKRQVVLKIYPTVIQVIAKQKAFKTRMTSNLKQNGSSKKWSVGQENKKLFEDEEEENFLDDTPKDEQLHMLEDEEEENDDLYSLMQEYESVDNHTIQNTMLTPFKGSMLGGAIFGEPEGSEAADPHSQKANALLKNHFIYLCEIERIIAISNYFVIIKRNQEIEKFIFKNDDRQRELLNQIKKSHREIFKTNIFYFNLQVFEQSKMFDDIEHFQRDGKVIYSQNVGSYTWDGIIDGLQLELDENYIYETEKNQKRIRKRCLLIDLETIRILDKNPQYNLVLVFSKEIEMVLRIPSKEEREKLLSAILLLRSFIIPQGFIDQLTILINNGIDFSQRILGHDPFGQSQYIQEYETLLFRKISENIHYKDNMKINNLIEETLLNASFSQLIKIDIKLIKIILKEIQNCLETYMEFELKEGLLVDQAFQKKNKDDIIDYFGHKNSLQKKRSDTDEFDPQLQLMSMAVDVEDIEEKTKIFEQCLHRTVNYLNILALFLNSKVFLTEMAEHEDLMGQLIKCLISKSPYISLLASRALKGIVHHYSAHEGKAEMNNKKVLIRGKNKEGILLLMRCFPKALIERVDTPIDLNTRMSWNEQEWEEFFSILINKNFDSATEQWNNETRNELKSRLEEEIYLYEQSKKIHEEVRQGKYNKDLLLPNHEINREKKIICRNTNLKWNYMEFEIKYSSLSHKYLVWKYYLTKLLQEKSDKELSKPHFTVIIGKPVVFWNELQVKFMSSFDEEEQIMIIKTMCILYNNFNMQLKQLKSMSFWIKILKLDQYQHCHFIILQFIHVCLSVKNQNALKNMKIFIKSDGLNTLLNCMKLVFKELLTQDEKNTRNNLLRKLHDDQIFDNVNYTNSDTNFRYFKRNSENICMGILSLKILDLIFREISSIDYIPLPRNIEFLLSEECLSTIVAMLMIENADLTRELTIFISMHLNNHYSLYKLRDSGLIEYLIRCLSSRNGDRALEILEKIQEVCADYNIKLKLGLFNFNDLNMIQKEENMKFEHIDEHNQSQDNEQALTKRYIQEFKTSSLQESIFLAYFPIPLIKFLYENGKQKFLEVYKMQNYESPILIWNSELRQRLEDTIKDQFQSFIDELKDFASKDSQEIKNANLFPKFQKKFRNNIVQYPTIENEVRCGRYYLRVWVQQKKDQTNFFRIPLTEEKEFQKNLETELRQCFYEDQSQNHQKIIILFKASLLAQKTCQKKEFLHFSEGQKILLDTTVNDNFEYNDTIKQIIHLGIKILFYNLENFNQFNKDALTNIGNTIFDKVFDLILKNSFIKKRINSPSSNLNLEDSENKRRTFKIKNTTGDNIIIDRVEAKILANCISFLNVIVTSDFQSFAYTPLNARIKLLKQISRFVELGSCLYDNFRFKQLTPYLEGGIDSKTYSSSQVNMYSNIQPKKYRKSKKRSKSRSKSQKREQSQPRSQQQFYPLNNNSSAQNYLQQSLIKGQDKYNGTTDDQNKKIKRKYFNKDSQIDYQSQPLLKIIESTGDNYSIALIFNIQAKIFNLIKQLSTNPLLHPELIASGIIWKAILQVYFYLKEEVNKYSDIKASIKSAIISLKNLISFITEVYQKGGIESFPFKNLTKDIEKGILKNFKDCITKLFSKKVIETLISSFQTYTNVLYFSKDFDPNRFLAQFSVLEEASPELVWNDETRQELFKALEEQLKDISKDYVNQQQISSNYCDKLLNFDYSVNQKELRVQNIFVRHFNGSNDFKLENNNSFALALFEKIKQTVKDQFLIDLTQENHQNCVELVRAFDKLLVQDERSNFNQKPFLEKKEEFQSIISTFCQLIKIKDSSAMNDQVQITRIKEISELVLSMLKHLTRNVGTHFEIIRYFRDFNRLLIRCLYGKEKDIVNMDDLIIIIKNVLSYTSIDVNKFLIKSGLIMFILYQIFESNSSKNKYRAKFTQLLLQHTEQTESIYQKYIPEKFFVEIQQKYEDEAEVEKFIQFLSYFDSIEFNNVFIIWNSQLKKVRHQAIREHCENILKKLEESNKEQEFVFIQPDLDNQYLENELRVSEIILRIYNQNPAVYIHIKLNTFILHLSNYLSEIAQELFRIFQLDQKIFEQEYFAHNQKKFNYMCYQSKMLLTSILLSIEQLHYNEFNQNRLMSYQKQDKNVEKQFYKQLIEKTTDLTQLDIKVYSNMGFFLQSQVFLNRNMPIENRITWLQIIYLLIDVADAVKILKENQIEESLVLLITQKMVRKDPELIPTLLTHCLQKLVKIYERKKNKKLIEFIFVLMANDSQYKQSVMQQISQYQLSAKIDTRILSEGIKNDHTDQQKIMKIWRTKPNSAIEAQRYYNMDNLQFYIEEKLDETNILTINLPLLSKSSIHAIRKEDIYNEDRTKIEDYPKDSLTNNQSAILDGNQQEDMKSKLLGFKPVLNGIMEDVDIEPIEKKSEHYGDSFQDSEESFNDMMNLGADK